MPEADSRLIFAGTPEFAAKALEGLIAANRDVVAVLTQPDRPAGRGRRLAPSAVKEMASRAGLPILQPRSLIDASVHETLASYQPDLIVVAAYGLMIPPAVLTMPSYGCLNIHASLLPRWRGAAPIQRAILAGDRETGISMMQMDEGLDTGPVWLQRRLQIGASESAGELHDRLAELGRECLLEVLPTVIRGQCQPRPQPCEGSTYARKLDKREAVLDFLQSAVDLERRVRAFNPWPVAEATLDGQRVRLWRARCLDDRDVLDQTRADPQSSDSLATSSGAPAEVAPVPGQVLGWHEDALVVACGTGRLGFLEMQRAGGKVLPARVFARDLAIDSASFSTIGGQTDPMSAHPVSGL